MFQALSLATVLALLVVPQGGQSGGTPAGGTSGNGTPSLVKCPCHPNPSNSYTGDTTGANANTNICRDGTIQFNALRITPEKGECHTPSGSTMCNHKEVPCTAEQEMVISFSTTHPSCVVSVHLEGGGFPAGATANASRTATLSASADCGATGKDKVTVSYTVNGQTHSFYAQLDLTCGACNTTQ